MCDYDSKFGKEWSGIGHVGNSWMGIEDRFAMWNFLANRIFRKLGYKCIEGTALEGVVTIERVKQLNSDWNMHLIFDHGSEKVHPAYGLEIGAELLFGVENVMSLVDIEAELDTIITGLKDFEKIVVVSL